MKIETILIANCSEWNQYLDDDMIDDYLIEKAVAAAKEKAEREEWDGDSNRN